MGYFSYNYYKLDSLTPHFGWMTPSGWLNFITTLLLFIAGGVGIFIYFKQLKAT